MPHHRRDFAARILHPRRSAGRAQPRLRRRREVALREPDAAHAGPSVVARAALAARGFAHGAAIIGAAYAGAADAAQSGHALLITGVIAGLGAALVAVDGAPGIVVSGLGGARLRLGQDRKPDQGRQRYCAHGCLPVPTPTALTPRSGAPFNGPAGLGRAGSLRNCLNL